MKWMLTVLIAMGMAVPVGAMAQAKPQSRSDSQQVDIGVSGYEAFMAATSGNGTQETPTNSAGGLLEVRYLYKPLVGAEIAYGFNKANTTFAKDPSTCATYFVCNEPTTKLTTKASTVDINYVASGKFGKLRPFVVGGVGFYITASGSSTYGVREVIRATYDVGGGVDYGFLTHWGLRLQVRDNFFKAPNNSSLFPATGVTTTSLKPMGGIYYKF